MKYVVKEKFELAVYLDKLDPAKKSGNIVGGSYITHVVLTINDPSEEILKKVDAEVKAIADRFDHATLIGRGNKSLEWVKKFSDRVIVNEEPVTRESVAQILFNEIKALSGEEGTFELKKVITMIDFVDYEVVVDKDTKGETYFSEAIFNS